MVPAPICTWHKTDVSLWEIRPITGRATGNRGMRREAHVRQRVYRAIAEDPVPTRRMSAAEVVATPAVIALHCVMNSYAIPALALVDARVVAGIAAGRVVGGAHGLLSDQIGFA
jgi:hypothetical protein